MRKTYTWHITEKQYGSRPTFTLVAHEPFPCHEVFDARWKLEQFLTTCYHWTVKELAAEYVIVEMSR